MEFKHELNLELPEKVAVGQYSSITIVSHSEEEFFLDFSAFAPGVERPIIVSRIVTSPIHAVRILETLQENIEKYESKFGKIRRRATTPAPPETINSTINNTKK